MANNKKKNGHSNGFKNVIKISPVTAETIRVNLPSEDTNDLPMQNKERLSILESILNQKKMLNFREACAYIGISRSTMYKLTSAKKIPHYKTAGLRFDRTELDIWLRSNKVPSICEPSSKK